MIHIVLVEPEIPQNTGNIARTCVATGSPLHLIKPLGFSLEEKTLKRAGLDYWKDLDLHVYESLEEFLELKKNCSLYFASTKGKKVYSDIAYPDNSYILFGKETKGLPEDLLRDNYDKTIRIPMINDTRSLNLSNSVALILYEVLRQFDFINLKKDGFLNL